jgi:hypothetical protein
MSAQDYPLFKQYPLNGQATLSVGPAPTPYHIYDGSGLLIGGTVNAAAAQQLLKAEPLTPLQNAAGRVFMGIWVCDFTDASLGAHHELQFSFFMADRPTGLSATNPLALLRLMLVTPGVQMLCHGLWNNTPLVVAYNRELLSLNARLAQSQIGRTAQALNFSFADSVTQQPIFSGTIHQPRLPSLRASFGLIGQVGFARGMALAQKPWLSLNVRNPVGVGLNRNGVAETFTKNDVNNVRYFDPRTDKLTFGPTPYATLDFTPQFVQYMEGFKFVYLQPK